jgi:hypothetical protein
MESQSEKGKKLLVVNNYKFGKAHVFKCRKIRWLNFQAETYVKINSAQRSLKKLRCNIKNKQEFIKTTIELYNSGNLRRLHFVKKLSFYYLP